MIGKIYIKGRMTLRPFSFLAAIAALGLSAAPSFAADTNGNFAIKGAGLQTCEKFTTAFEEQNTDIMLYGGWIDGYLTGKNQHVNGVFDLASWQNTQTLLGLTKSACAQLPADTQFMSAFDKVVRVLFDTQLDVASEITGLKSGTKQSFVYKATLEQMQSALAGLGYEVGADQGVFDATTAASLQAFQKDKNLPVSGLPDQRTLFELFVRAKR